MAKKKREYTPRQTRAHLEEVIAKEDRKDEDQYAWLAFADHVHEIDFWGTNHEIYSAWSFFLAGFLADKEI